MKRLAVALCALMMTAGARAQEAPAKAPAATQQQEPQQQEPEHHGKVLMERDAETAPAEGETAQAAAAAPEVTLSDAEREAPVFTAYDLEVHLKPATAEIAVHARLRVRNGGAGPMTLLPMQLSSTLRWDAISVESGGEMKPAEFRRQVVDSDVDHTGRVAEAIVALPKALAAGAEMAVDVLYSGKLPVSAERLERIGAPADDATASDWDGVGPETNLRGFGNVLWYPAASAPALLGDGAKVFQAMGRARLQDVAATARLRLTVEYAGEAPDAAYFCGRRNPLKAISEDANLPVAEGTGVATAEWAARPLGFRTMSLFVTESKPVTAGDGLVSAITEQDGVVESYAAAAQLVRPLLEDWFGERALGTLTLIDHAGQPYEDGTLLVTPLAQGSATSLTPGMAHVLTHAWFRSKYAWLDQGMPEFVDLLWLERSQGREAALQVLQEHAQPVALGEPAAGTEGQSLVETSSDVVYRYKAAAALWMLRLLVGDDAMKQAMKEYRARPTLDDEPTGFEQAVEIASGKDLKWFFDDWVYHDRGLPVLSVVNVTPNQLSQKPGESPSWLVSVEVKNAGEVAASVPVLVRSMKGTTTQMMHVDAHGSAIVRLLFSDRPTEVVVNDGSVPEMVISRHVRELVAH